jgi:hypothetical protein
MGTTRRITFDTVREIGEQLPGTEVGTAYGSPALKVNGRIYAGIAVNKEAEPNSLGVYLADFDQREALFLFLAARRSNMLFSAPGLWITSFATRGTVYECFDALQYLPSLPSCRWPSALAQTPRYFS